MSDVQILSNTRCTLGEGPFYCGRRDTLYWFDIVERRRYAHDFATGIESFINLPEMASAMAVIDAGHDAVFLESGLWIREVATGCWTPLCAIEADDDLTRCNDARVHPSGAMWLGTMSKTLSKGAGAIYHFRAGRLTTLYTSISIPNAICFSPDGATGYFTDTVTGKLMTVALDPATGLPVEDPTVLVDKSADDGGIDGAICDAKGFIWNANWGTAALNCYDPSGALVSSHAMPANQVSCPASVGGGRVAVTSAREGLDDAQSAADPDAGKTFLLDVGCAHRAEPPLVI